MNIPLTRYLLLALTLLLLASGPANAEELRVGAVLPLTGPVAEYGVSIKNGIELAQRDKPLLFRNIRFIYEDAQYDVKRAVSAFNKLTGTDGARLIYVWGVPFCQGIAPLAERSLILTVAQCVDSSVSRGRRFVVRFMNPVEDYMRATAEFLSRSDKRKLGVVVTDNAYLEAGFRSFEGSLRPGQTVQLIERFDPLAADFRSTISKIKASSYDAIGIFLSAGQIAAFYRQMSEQKGSVATFGTNFFESRSEIRASSGAMDGAVYAHHEVRPEFVQHYQSANSGAQSQLAFASFAYEFATLVGELFGGADKPPSSDEMLKAVTSIGPRVGTAIGPYRYRESADHDRYFEFPVVIKTIRADETFVVDRNDLLPTSSSAR